MKRMFNVRNMFVLFAIVLISLVVEVILLTIRFKKSSYEYSHFLTDCFLRVCIGMIAVFIIFMLAGIIIFKMFGNYIESWMMIVWAIFIIFGLVWLQCQIQMFSNDIQYEDYVVYTGDFEKSSTRGYIFLRDNSSSRIYNTNETFLKTGHYSGELIYAKRTKYVLSYSLDSGQSSKVNR